MNWQSENSHLKELEPLKVICFQFKEIKQLEIHFKLLESGYWNQLKMDYENNLFRKDKPSTFKDADGELFAGIILGISDSGNLKVQIEDGIVKEFDLKEITLLY